MKRIYKYPIETTDEQRVKMPKNAEILCVQTQAGNPCLWAVIDDKQVESEDRTILIYGTGHPIGDKYGLYVGTYQLLAGKLIFHVFEARP